MYCIPLSSAADTGQAGGKAANLALALQRGLPVPDGFVLSRTALRAFLEANRFDSIATATLAGYPALAWRERLAQFDALRAADLTLPVPRQVRSEAEPLLLRTLALSPAGVAVRSSGICEDLGQASFAGIYASFLGITSLESFWRGVVDCWCSTWSPQAAAYAEKMGHAVPIDGMGVLVQLMVPAERSGVALTADPVTGNPWHFVLNATFGLGSSLVDGSAPADRYVLAWDSGEILERRIECKPDMVVLRAGQVCRIATGETRQCAASLSDDDVSAVGRLALAIDRAFDRRMDLEWAFAACQLYLLQARPLTALPGFFPHELSPAEAQETWTPYPGWYAPLNAQERLVAPFHRGRWQIALWQRFLAPGDIFPRLSAVERDFHGYRYATPWRWQGSALDGPGTERWLDEHEARLRQEWLAQLERVHRANAWVDDQMVRLAEDRTAQAVHWLRVLLTYMSAENEMQAAVWYAPQWLIFTCESLLARLIADVMVGHGIADLVSSLVQGLSCYSVERTIAAQALGRVIDEDAVRDAFAGQPLSQVIPFLRRHHPECAFLAALTSFCRRFGMELPPEDREEAMPELDLSGVLLVIKAAIMGEGVNASATLAQTAARRRAVEGQACSWLRGHRPDQLDRFLKLLSWSQFWTPALDNRKWHVTMSVRLHELIRQTKQALAAAGLIDQPDHLLLLTQDDWAAYVDRPDPTALRSLYRQRQHEYERDRRLEPLPYLGRPPTAAASQPASTQEGQSDRLSDVTLEKRVFHGEGIAPGRARGTAYKVASLDNAASLDNLTDKHILVCGRDSFNAQWRRDWYSLFMVVRGLVTVQGAQLHHTSQIARECGVPFINLPTDELAALPENALIEIDGQAGTLTVM